MVVTRKFLVNMYIHICTYKTLTLKTRTCFVCVCVFVKLGLSTLVLKGLRVSPK